MAPPTTVSARPGIFHRKFLVNPRVQLEIIAYSLTILVAVLGAVAIAVFRAFDQFGSPANVGFLPAAGSPYWTFLSDQRAALVRAFVLASAASIVCLSLGLLLISNRLAGPLFRLTRALREAAREDTALPEIHFREADYFHDLAASINEYARKNRPED